MQRLLSVLLWALCAGAIVAQVSPAVAERSQPLAQAGVIDLTDWDFARDGIVDLAGEWKLAWSQFEDPTQPESASAARSVVTVPGAWNGVAVPGGAAGGSGYATYALSVKCRSRERLALALPLQHSALRIYVNGKIVAVQGSPGGSAELARPAYMQQIAPLEDAACPLRIVAHVSNYEMRRGGLLRDLELGTERQVRDRRELGLARDLISIGGLGVLGLLPILFFFWRRSDRTPLWFGLYVLSSALLVGMAGERVMQRFLAPLGWEVTWKIAFLCMIGGLAAFPAFLRSLYPQAFPRAAFRAVLAGTGLFALLVIATPTWIFTQATPALIGGGALIAALLVFVLVRAGLQRRRGAWAMLAGLAVLVAAGIYDTVQIPYQTATKLAPYGLFVFVLAPATLLAQRFARALRAEELRSIEQQQRADLLVRATQAGLLDWDATSNRTTYSERFKEMLGYAPDTDTDKWPLFFEFIHPDDRARIRSSFLSQLRDHSSPNTARQSHDPADYRVQKADGSYLWVHAEAISLTGEDGRTLRYICSFMDISERKQQEIELSDRIKFIRDMFDSVPIALALRDASGRYLFVNRTWERYTGAQRDEVVGTSAQEQFSAGEADTMLELDRAALERGPDAPVEPHDFSHRGRHYLQTRTVMNDARGRPMGVLIASIDTTEQRALERQLADRAKFVSELVDALPISVALRDPEGRYVQVNRTWERYFGVKREDALGRRRREFPGWKSSASRLADADEIEKLDRETLARGPDYVAEPQETQRLGRHYLITRRALFDSDGKPIGVLSAGVDMSERREMEERLREQVALTHAIVTQAPNAIFAKDREGRFTLANRGWAEMSGVDAEFAIGRTAYDVYPPEIAKRFDDEDRKLLAQGASAPPIEAMHTGPRPGQYRIVRKGVLSRGDTVIGLVCSSTDISEIKRIEERLERERERLAESEARYDVAMRAVNEGVYDWNVAEGTIYYADSVFRSLGMPTTLKTPDDWRDRIHPEDRAKYDAAITAHFKGASDRFECDYRYRAADDSWRWARQHGIAQRNKKGRAIRMIGATGDITELKQAELALARERERLELLVRATKAGFMDWDARTDKQVYSGRFKEMLGYPRDADTSNWPPLFEMMHPDDREPTREAFRAMLRRVVTTGERQHGPLEYRLRKADGSYLWVRGEGIAEVGADGRTERFLTSYIDVTHLREMNRALEESVRLREEVDRMSRHDLKTPLNAIIGLSRLLREEVELNPDDADVVARIEQAGLRLLGMINLSLNMFRMEQGTYSFAPKALPLREVLEQTARDLRSHAAAKKVTVRIDGERHAAWAEELLCYSMLGNLVKNAIEASPEGATVGISMAKQGGDVVVRIHNKGAVPEAIRARFFEKYSTSGKSGGTGLGTYSARLMARVQLGDIEMQTADESGTTLTVRLSAAPEADAAVREPVPAAPSASSSVPRSILVVDDDEFSRLVVQRSLPRSSRVSVAPNGREALDLVRVNPPDAIVMDLDMPVMGGLEAAARIREWEKQSGRKRCTMIAASSHDDEATRARALEAGFDAYLEKPVSPDALRRLLADFFLATEPIEVDPDLRKLMPEFLRSRRALAAELAQAVDRGEAEAARAIAHKLAGSCLPYGFHWAARQGKMIEQRARDRALEGLAAEVRALREHFDTVEVRVDDPVAEEKR